jgi:diguanylate cyclase (GGDEF)-like protein
VRITLKSQRDVLVFTVAIMVLCVAGNMLLEIVLLGPDLARQLRVPGMISASGLGAVIAYMLGCHMLADYRLAQELEQALQRDQLTGALTRRAFLERARALVGCRCAVIVTDIDDFKGFNDAYGHLAGDKALKQVAQTLMLYCREEDIVARFGGEEFLLILPGYTLGDGERAADELCQLLRSTPVMVHGRSITVTASFGVSEVLAFETIDRAIARADAALYTAKRKGRDRVCIAA